MSRNLPFLAAMLALAVLVPAVSAASLTVNPSNSRYFTDGSGKTIYLTGSHTWNNFLDSGTVTDNVPGPITDTIDYNGYLNMMQSYNHNFMRLWNYEGWESGGSSMPYAVPLPYNRTGPGNAIDGGLKFNLTQYNQAYFDRLRSRVIAAGDKGIYVGIMLFQGWDIGQKISGYTNPWPGHPYNANNNINGINGDINGDGQGWEVHSLQNSSIVTLEENYVKKAIDTVNDLNNVVYEISNEDWSGSVEWQYHMIDFIHSYESTYKPKQHLVGMTGGFTSDASLFASNADWISPSDPQYATTNPPVADGRKAVIIDSDHLSYQTPPYDGFGRDRYFVWRSFTRGDNPIEMDSLATDSARVGMRMAMGQTLNYANKMNLAAMTPQGSLSTTGFCLASVGSEYLIYQPNSGAFTVTLDGGTYTVEWLNPNDGTVTQQGNISGTSYAFNPPFSGDAVLYLKFTSSPSTTPIAYWKFDEGSGTTASDSSGNGNTGTLVNGPVWTTGKIGGALSLDGVDDYVSVADPGTGSALDFDTGSSITISLWARFNTLPNYRSLITKGSTAGTSFANYGIINGNPGQVEFLYRNSADTLWEEYRTTSSYLATDTWYHIVATYTFGTDTSAKIYVNGAEKAGSWVNGDGKAAPYVSNEALWLGAGDSNGAGPINDQFDGSLDDVRIYSRALSPNQIQTIYSGTRSDSNSDGCVSDPELTAFIDKWKVNNQDVILRELIESIGLWKRGC